MVKIQQHQNMGYKMRTSSSEGQAQLPRMRTIREVAATGLLSEYALRLLEKQGKLPSIRVGTKILINLDLLIQQLNNPKGENLE